MSSYVIYPADELLLGLLAYEYSVTSKRNLPSPIVPNSAPPDDSSEAHESDSGRVSFSRRESQSQNYFAYAYAPTSPTSIVFPVSGLTTSPEPSPPLRPPSRVPARSASSSFELGQLGPPPPLPPRGPRPSKLAPASSSSSASSLVRKVSFPISTPEKPSNRATKAKSSEDSTSASAPASLAWNHNHNHVGVSQHESSAPAAKTNNSGTKIRTTFSFNRILSWKSHDKIQPVSSTTLVTTTAAAAAVVVQKTKPTPTLQFGSNVKGRAPVSAPPNSAPPNSAPLGARRFTFQVIHEEDEEVDDFLSFRDLHKRPTKENKPAVKGKVLKRSKSERVPVSNDPKMLNMSSTNMLNMLGTGGGSGGGSGGGVTGLPAGGIIGSLSSGSSSSGIGVGPDVVGLPPGVLGIGPPAGVMTGASSVGAAGGGAGESLRDMVHPSLNEALKAHNSLSFKLIRIVSDFTQQLSQIHEQHSVELQHLVENFRKRNGEIRKERPPCSSTLFQVWETLLQEVEIDSQTHSDISGSLGRQVARQLLEKTFCRKIQSRKIFAHRESFETVLNKSEALLSNAYRDYCEACELHLRAGSSASLAQYYETHNAYVHQLRGTNAMLKEYQSETLPALLQELEEIYVDICAAVADSVLNETEIITSRGHEGCRRYENLIAVCRNVNGIQDLRDYVKCMVMIPPANQKYAFTLPAILLPGPDGSMDPAIQDPSRVPILKDEVISDRLTLVSLRSRHESLKKEMGELESEMRQLQDSLDTIIRMQHRSLESNLFNKANELQEEISMKKFDVRVGQMKLSAMRAQRELYTTKSDAAGGSNSQMMNNTAGGGGGASGGADGSSSGYMSSSSSFIRDRKTPPPPSTMKTKWLKAFRSLKSSPPQPSTPLKEIKKNGKDKDIKDGSFQIFENHIFQEYTYKKITPCDICSQILRGHTKQGMRCRMCKTNVHFDCQAKVGKCQPKTRLLRRQKSTSELETRLSQLGLNEQGGGDGDGGSGSGSRQDLGPGAGQQRGADDQPDIIYQVLKQATDMKRPPGRGGADGSVSSGSGSGNGVYGSSQTIYSQQQQPDPYGGAYASSNPGPSTQHRRSNPTVNVIGNSSHSGTSTPALAQAQAATFHPSSSGESMRQMSQRRDSYTSRKSISADADGSAGVVDPAMLQMLPPPRAISLPSTQTPHSPRRRKLDLRMKSFSLDSPESTEHAQRRRFNNNPGSQSQSHSTSHSQYMGSNYVCAQPPTFYKCQNGGQNGHHTNQPVHTTPFSYSYHYQSTSLNSFAPSSPVHNRRGLLTARNVRMSSVELPDENDKSLSSASTSPCPSPQKPHRLLPTNLYVVLYMFKARHPDELDLKAGYKVTVVDTTDPDWWQGKCLGRIGYFPSKYVTKLHPGEKPLQVTHNLQVTDGAENGLKLLRDQIVIQIGEELDGMVTIRNGENKQGVCPLRYLQEV